jgi:tetratricopeptide (TPR) repeat protein
MYVTMNGINLNMTMGLEPPPIPGPPIRAVLGKIMETVANGYDSLGEAYMKKGDKENAIKYYEKALVLDPKMGTAIEALKKLRN